jgi:hypothetical protein
VWTLYRDINLQRVFEFTKKAKAKQRQMLTANISSSNILNHQNATAVGGIRGSPIFGGPY